MACFRQQEITAVEAAHELGITPRRFRQLYHRYLQAVAKGQAEQWSPGRSGGNRQREIPPEVEALWRRLFAAKQPASYSFAAVEASRQFGVSVDRATVRRWACDRALNRRKPRPKDPTPVRRWQCAKVGTLWQLDASPHRWFPDDSRPRHLLDMLDDCSRYITGARLYDKENLHSYLDFLPRAFETYGLPLALYVDYHSFFFTHIPDALTYLGSALHFYDISLNYAPTPQAKGKVERLHQLWQNRLPCLFSAEGIHDTVHANPLLEDLRRHRNHKEIHRELKQTPQQAWNQALREGRSDLRPKPRCPWWNYIWSVRTPIKIDVHGTVPAGTQRYRIDSCSPGSSLIRCEHRDGSFSFLIKPPRKGKRPIVVLRIEAQK